MSATAKESQKENTLLEGYITSKSEVETSCKKESFAFDMNRKIDYNVIYPEDYYEYYIANFKQCTKRKFMYCFFKRFFDIIFSFLMLIVLSPLFLIITVAICCESKGGAIFKQKRIGKKGKPFTCYKFRSMRTDAPKEIATSLLKNPELYQTRVGKLIRKLSLDELPQLFNVFIGNMSFIGYRPLVVTEQKCNDMRDRLGVFKMKPGISGYAQVYGRDDVHYKNKAILDAVYVKRASLWIDCKLVFKTIGVVFSKHGNHDGVKSKCKKSK